MPNTNCQLQKVLISKCVMTMPIAKYQMLIANRKLPNTYCQLQIAKCKMLNAQCKIQNAYILISKCKMLIANAKCLSEMLISQC